MYTIREQRGEIHLAVILCAMLCIAQQNLSISVNVVCDGSPSLMRRVLLISFGITILPKSSTLLTMPVAFIYLSPFTILYGTTERPCHSERSSRRLRSRRIRAHGENGSFDSPAAHSG